MRPRTVLVAALAVAGCSLWSGAKGAPDPSFKVVAIPHGEAGIGFDDLGYSPALHRVLVPAGRTGNLDLLDPDSGAIREIAGFSSQARFGGGHGEGTTSADTGRGLLFASDRTARSVVVIDATSGARVGEAALQAGPDYVRYVAPSDELWVTEPSKDQIEVFSLPGKGTAAPPVPVSKLAIPVPGGPESLVVDAARGRAYTHLWGGTTLAIDLASHAVVARWPNGCSGSRGIALDAARGFLMVGCEEGKAVVIDVTRGVVLGSLGAGSGVDIIGYNPTLAHLYLPGAESATLAVIGISKTGKPSLLATLKTAGGAHCAVSDDRNDVWVCDPDHGRLLWYKDPFPATP